MSSTALAPFEPPNHVYSAFAFISFMMCVVPVYWHLEGKIDPLEGFIWDRSDAFPWIGQLGIWAPCFICSGQG